MSFRKRTTTIPLPKVVAPSGDFDGNDGKWSTFSINIGDDETGRGQNFKVLISTSSRLTLVPQQADWCAQDCAAKRGVEVFNAQQPLGFLPASSKAWNMIGQYGIPLPSWWTGDKPNGTWGTDNVGLGESSKTSLMMGGQWVVEYTFSDLYMGSFGVGAGAINLGGGSTYSFLTNFAVNNTPSTSYGYTAGASYQNNSKGVPGNLVLGGFDESRLSKQRTSIPMPSSSTDLIVGVQSIIYHPDRSRDANDYSLTYNSSGFSAVIDSTLPYLWLPDSICDEFASRFKLQYDKTRNMYTLNSTAHEYNLQQNATVTFLIGDGPQLSNDATTITLPYAAFNLQAGSPIFPNSTNYFPIKKSPTGIFVLGRTFLQETYLIVDYERANFTISPAVFSNPMPDAKITPIYNKEYTALLASPTSTVAPGKKGGLAPGTVAGIVVGIVVVFLLLGLGAFFWWKKRRAAQQPSKPEVSEIDTMTAGTEVKVRRISELDTDPQGKPLGGYYANGRDQKDVVPFPPISEMESPPAELYSPPPETPGLAWGIPGNERTNGDYFNAKPRRRGATRESSGNNTPAIPAIHELAGDDGQFQVGGVHFDRVESPTPERPMHSRGPSDTSLHSNIDAVISGQRPEGASDAARPELQRRPSHVRGASDITVQSDTTAVSQPTPEEMENWAASGTEEPRRPLSE